MIKLRRLKRTTLTQRTVEQLIKLVKDGSLKPADRLPSEKALVEMFGVSRSAVREALQSLAALHVIEIHNGRGSFVKSVAPDQLIRSDVLATLLEGQSFLQALETRRLLEVGAAGLAAERATERDLDAIRRTLESLRKAAKDRDDDSVGSIAWEFHLNVAKASQNDVLAGLIGAFARLSGRIACSLKEAVPDYAQEEYWSHAVLYKAISSRDSQTARLQMEKHIRFAESVVLTTHEPEVANYSDHRPGVAMISTGSSRSVPSRLRQR